MESKLKSFISIVLPLCILLASSLSAKAETKNGEDPGDFDEAAFISGEEQSGGDKKKSGFGVDIHGSFENQLTAVWPKSYDLKEDIHVYDYLQLRVDLDAALPLGMTLKSDIVGKLFVGNTSFKMVDMIPKQSIDELIEKDSRFAFLFDETFDLKNQFYLDNAYLKIPIKKVLLTLGKQPLAQGAGYIWNPTDVYTKKDMLDPTYQKRGDIALKLMIPFGETASLDFLGVPSDDFKNWGTGGRLSFRMGRLSLSAVSYLTTTKSTDYEGSIDAVSNAISQGKNPEDALLTTNSRRTLVGGDAVMDIFGVRFWVEGAYNFIAKKDGAPSDWWELSTGFEYYFSFETHIMFEYYHYARGPLQVNGAYSYNDWMRAFEYENEMLGKNFMFESIDHPIADYWTVGLSSFQSLSDSSAIITGDVRWAFIEDAELWLMIAGQIGNRNDFLSSARGQSWLRLKVFF